MRWVHSGAVGDPIVVLLAHVVFKELRANIELNRIVIGCDGFDIPFNVIQLMVPDHVVHVVDDKKSEKDRYATNEKAELTSLGLVLVTHDASCLYEDVRVIIVAFFIRETRSTNEYVLAYILE